MWPFPRFRDILTARTRLQWLATAVVATVVTVFVAVPLTRRALDARSDDDRPLTAPTDGIIATLGSTTGPVDGATLSHSPVITFEISDTGATVYRLVDEADNEISTGTDDLGPDFSMVNTPDGFPAAFDTTALPDGQYTIYVTFTVVDLVDGGSTETYRMATFAIANES